MNVVGKVGSLISQGVYSVATPFHPFGGAVDVIVVEQQDGTYRSTPWYVRFGKFQGFIKGAEKMVRISVNGVEANFHMYLDNSGEAYFIREDEGEVKNADVENGTASASGIEKEGVDKNEDDGRSSCRSNSGEVEIMDDRAVLGTDRIEKSELDDERRLYGFEGEHPPRLDSMGSSDYRAYYDRLDQGEDAVENQASDSEVVLLSVDGHVITAPISTTVDNADDLQLSTPQFRLGPGEGAGLNGESEGFGSGHDTWTADFSDIDVSAPNNVLEDLSKHSESDKVDVEVGNQVPESPDKNHIVDQNSSSDQVQESPDKYYIVDQNSSSNQVQESPDKYHIVDQNSSSNQVQESPDKYHIVDQNSSSDQVQESPDKYHIVDQNSSSNQVQESPDKYHIVDQNSSSDQVQVSPDKYHIVDQNSSSDQVQESPDKYHIVDENSSSDQVQESPDKYHIVDQNSSSDQVQESPDKYHIVDQNSSSDVRDSRKDVFKSCLELSKLQGHVEVGESNELGPSCTELGDKEQNGESQENSPSSILSVEENKDEGDLKFENSATSSSHNFDSPRMSPHFTIEAEASESNALAIDNTCVGSDSVSLHSLSNEPEWKDDHYDLIAESQEVDDSPVRSTVEQECDTSEPVEPQTGSSDAGIQLYTGLGFEISLCGNLLHAGMGLRHASEVFDAYRISEEEFKISASSIIKEENLIVRFKGRYFSWAKAAPLVLGMAAFGLDLLDEMKDAILVEHDDTPKRSGDGPEMPTTPTGSRWRLWPNPFRRVKTLQHTTSSLSNEDVFVDSESGSQNPRTDLTPPPNTRNESPRKKLVRTNVPTTEQIASLNLKDGQNMITFSFSTRVLGTQQVDAHIYLWKWNARIVISDVDGTITKSDVLGQFMPLVGKDWTQSGVACLFSAIKENGYQLLFLSARAIVQAYLTRSFLLNIKQDGKTLPNGPVVISPDGLFPSLYREVIRRAPHEFKIACLEDIKALFPSDYNPFYAGFGNRDTDELSYRKIGIPKGKIFIINPKGEVAISHRIGVKSYTSLHTLVNDMFPPTSMVEQEDFNAWNYWRTSWLPNIDGIPLFPGRPEGSHF